MIHGINTKNIMDLYESGKIDKGLYDSMKEMQERINNDPDLILPDKKEKTEKFNLDMEDEMEQD